MAQTSGVEEAQAGTGGWGSGHAMHREAHFGHT